MTTHREVRSGTPTWGQEEHRHDPLAKLRAAHQRDQEQGQENQDLLAQFVAERSLVIPENENCIDTVRLCLLHAPALRDRGQLLKLGFTLQKNQHRAKKLPDGTLDEPDPGAELWHRHTDGCRVELFSGSQSKEPRCSIEACPARIIGIQNHRLHELTTTDVRHVLEILTESVLRWTTWHATPQGKAWAIVRMDTARDFPGNAAAFAKAYQFTNWPRVRTPRFPEQMSNGCWWTSKSKSQRPHQLRLYDKGIEMINSGDPQKMEAAPEPGTVVRVERRYVGKLGMTALRKLLHGTAPEIRVRGSLVALVDNEIDGGRIHVPLNLRGLHVALAYEIGKLRSTPRPASSKHEVLARAYVRDPIFRAEFDANWRRKARHAIHALAAEIQQSSENLDLLDACYGSPLRK